MAAGALLCLTPSVQCISYCSHSFSRDYGSAERSAKAPSPWPEQVSQQLWSTARAQARQPAPLEVMPSFLCQVMDIPMLTMRILESVTAHS